MNNLNYLYCIFNILRQPLYLRGRSLLVNAIQYNFYIISLVILNSIIYCSIKLILSVIGILELILL